MDDVVSEIVKRSKSKKKILIDIVLPSILWSIIQTQIENQVNFFITYTNYNKTISFDKPSHTDIKYTKVQ